MAIPRVPRVLFMHGLESGPGGSKARYLCKHVSVLCPSMEMSAYNPLRRNSPSRHVLAYLAAALVLARAQDGRAAATVQGAFQ